MLHQAVAVRPIYMTPLLLDSLDTAAKAEPAIKAALIGSIIRSKDCAIGDKIMAEKGEMDLIAQFSDCNAP